MTSRDIALLVESVRLRGARLVREPIQGERLHDYALDLMVTGALLGVQATASINLANHARLANAAEDLLAQTEPATVADSTTEGTDDA